MVLPTVTELPLLLEPVTPDPFLDHGAQASEPSYAVRELDHRASGGLHVRLLWRPATDQLLVAVAGAQRGDCFQVDVARGDELRAFHHPFAYAALKGAA